MSHKEVVRNITSNINILSINPCFMFLEAEYSNVAQAILELMIVLQSKLQMLGMGHSDAALAQH